MIDLDTDWQLYSFEAPKKPDVKDEKGACPKCGKHVGRGIRFHVMACDGHPSKAQ